LSFFLPSGADAADSFSGVTIDQPPADVAEAEDAAASATAGSAGAGAGVQAGSLGCIGVTSGAGRNVSGSAAGGA
jgi:hypothetical protein